MWYYKNGKIHLKNERKKILNERETDERKADFFIERRFSQNVSEKVKDFAYYPQLGTIERRLLVRNASNPNVISTFSEKFLCKQSGARKSFENLLRYTIRAITPLIVSFHLLAIRNRFCEFFNFSVNIFDSFFFYAAITRTYSINLPMNTIK